MSAKLITKRSAKMGKPPGTLIHLGERKVDTPIIDVMRYDATGFEEQQYQSLDQCVALRDKPTVTWINVEGIHQPQLIEKLGECFKLNALLLEDILSTDQRPKFEDQGQYLFVVMRMIYLHPKSRQVINEQVSLILGENYVLSLQEGREGDVFNPIRRQIRQNHQQLSRSGPDFLFHALIDAVVDNYFLVVEALGEQLEIYEERVAARPMPDTLRAIHTLRREMIFIRKSLWPTRELISSIERIQSTLISPNVRVLLRDVYDHVIQQIDTIETYRDILTAMLDVYLSSISNRTNEVMKVLTIIATIFIPLTFLAGVYGMNFQNFPEIHWRYGYLTFWVVCVVLTAIMLILFRRRRWL